MEGGHCVHRVYLPHLYVMSMVAQKYKNIIDPGPYFQPVPFLDGSSDLDRLTMNVMISRIELS